MEEKMSKKKQDIIIVICVITLVLSVCAIFCIYYSNKNDEFIFNEHLDEIVLTVKDDDNAMNISLQEILMIEKIWKTFFGEFFY